MIVVEHDEEAIRSADHVIDIGPGAESMVAMLSLKVHLKIFSNQKIPKPVNFYQALEILMFQNPRLISETIRKLKLKELLEIT